MAILFAVLIWFIGGGLLGFIFSLITASMGSHTDKSTWGCSLWGIVLSSTRMFIVFYFIRIIIGIAYKSPLFIGLAIADIAWCLLMMKWSSEKWGMRGNVSMYRTGVCIGSILFSVVFFVKIYI